MICAEDSATWAAHGTACSENGAISAEKGGIFGGRDGQVQSAARRLPRSSHSSREGMGGTTIYHASSRVVL